MEKEENKVQESSNNFKIIASTALGVMGGLVLGMYLFSPEKEKVRESITDKLNDVKNNLPSLKTMGDDLVALKDKAAAIVKEIDEQIEKNS